MLLVAGEAGIGKSRFVTELLRANSIGVVSAIGRCIEHGGEIRPLSAVAELLTALAPHARQFGIEMSGALKPVIDGALAGSSTALSRSPLLLDDAIEVLIRNVARHQPLVVVVEDLHWADDTTRRLVSSLARAHDVRRVLLVATYRSDELHRRHPLMPLLADLERSGGVERIELEPLTSEDVAAMAAAILERAVGDDEAAALWQRSGGNPFYAEELLAQGSDDGGLPTGVRHVILARSHMLVEEALVCLQAAATLASPIDREVLRTTSGLTTSSFPSAIDQLCRERFLVESAGGLTFRHELVREVFLDELLPGERTGMYARAAEALQRHRPDRLGEIARLHHAASQLRETLRASVAAGDAAASLGAMVEATEHYGRALDVWASVDRAADAAGLTYIDLLRRAACTSDLARDFDRAVELARLAADTAAALGDPLTEGGILNELAQYLWNASTPGLDDVIERALRVLPSDPPTVERASTELRFANRLRIRGRIHEADEIMRKVAGDAASLGAIGLNADALSLLEYEQAMLGDELVLLRMAGALQMAMAADERVAVKIAINLSNAFIFLGRYNDAVALLDKGMAAAERHGLMGTLGMLLQGNVVEALEPLGRWDEAARLVDNVRRRVSSDSVHRWGSALSGWAQIQLHRGRVDEVAAMTRRGFELEQSGYYQGNIGQLAVAMVELAARGAVEPVNLELVGSWLAQVPVDESTAAARLVAAAAAHLVPPTLSPDHAAALSTVAEWIERLQRIANEQYIHAPGVLLAWLRQARAELAGAAGGHADQQWSELVDEWRALDCPYFAAVAAYRQSEAILRRSGGKSAIERATPATLLNDAYHVALALGAKPLADDAVDLARRARLALSDQAPVAVESVSTDPFGLTQREHEVLNLVADGYSNGEIGTRLFVSRKTASVHVSNILRKLGASNRIEAAAIARRHGL